MEQEQEQDADPRHQHQYVEGDSAPHTGKLSWLSLSSVFRFVAPEIKLDHDGL